MGDMNAKLDKNRVGFEEIVGPHGSSNVTNDNGDRLTFVCKMNNLCTGNTFYPHKNIHKKTWRSPDGLTVNEIDYICINKRWRTSLQNVRVYRGADIGSDHYPVNRKIQA